jgi:glutathione S-transferase
VFWPVLRPLFIQLIRTPRGKLDSAVISEGEKLSLAAVRILDQRLSDRAFLAGDAFSMGDIPAAASSEAILRKCCQACQSWRISVRARSDRTELR